MARAKIDDGPPGQDRQSAADLALCAALQTGRSSAAIVALLLAAGATLAIPDGFRRVIDRGFVAGGGSIANQFNYLFVDGDRAGGGDRLPLLFRLDARREGNRRHARRGARQSASLEPRFFEENRPSEIASRVTSDTAVIEIVVGSTVSVALQQHRARRRRDHLSVHAGADADDLAADRHPAHRDADRHPRAPGSQHLTLAARTGSPTWARSSRRRWAR